jgi:hypothetical protein
MRSVCSDHRVAGGWSTAVWALRLTGGEDAEQHPAGLGAGLRLARRQADARRVQRRKDRPRGHRTREPQHPQPDDRGCFQIAPPRSPGARSPARAGGHKRRRHDGRSASPSSGQEQAVDLVNDTCGGSRITSPSLLSLSLSSSPSDGRHGGSGRGQRPCRATWRRRAMHPEAPAPLLSGPVVGEDPGQSHSVARGEGLVGRVEDAPRRRDRVERGQPLGRCARRWEPRAVDAPDRPAQTVSLRRLESGIGLGQRRR